MLDFFGEVLGPGTAGNKGCGGLGVDVVQYANPLGVRVRGVTEVERELSLPDGWRQFRPGSTEFGCPGAGDATFQDDCDCCFVLVD